MNPLFAAHDGLLFSSPVPRANADSKSRELPALYAQTDGKEPRRLTFGTTAALEPTVLSDGRILFVSAHASLGTNTRQSMGLFTINNDGTVGFIANLK